MAGLEQSVDLFAGLGDQVWILLLLFAAVALTVFGLASLVGGPDRVERRLAYGSSERSGEEPQPSVRPRDEVGTLKKLDAYLTPKGESEPCASWWNE